MQGEVLSGANKALEHIKNKAVMKKNLIIWKVLSFLSQFCCKQAYFYGEQNRIKTKKRWKIEINAKMEQKTEKFSVNLIKSKQFYPEKFFFLKFPWQKEVFTI